MCDTAGFLQVVVDAVNTLVNDCPECSDDDSDENSSTFQALEVKLASLLQDGVGGTPSVSIDTTSDDVRSNLELDITLEWSFSEAYSLQIDL